MEFTVYYDDNVSLTEQIEQCLEKCTKKTDVVLFSEADHFSVEIKKGYKVSDCVDWFINRYVYYHGITSLTICRTESLVEWAKHFEFNLNHQIFDNGEFMVVTGNDIVFVDDIETENGFGNAIDWTHCVDLTDTSSENEIKCWMMAVSERAQLTTAELNS